MRSVFYWLEDHFDALAETRRTEVSRRATNLLSRIFAALGDAVDDGTNWQPRQGFSEVHSRPR
jgi:hypothetical protein